MRSFCLSAWTSQKSLQKCPPGPLPGPPPGGGKSSQNGPKIRQEGLKTVPRALHVIFQPPLFRPERPPQADLAPKTPKRPPEAPRGAKFDPRVAKFDSRGFLFCTPGRRSLKPRAILCLLCSRLLARRNAPPTTACGENVFGTVEPSSGPDPPG